MFLKRYYYYFLLRNIEMQMMKYRHKIFASHLRQSGNEGEIVDLLQERVPKTVFARHYFTPSLEADFLTVDFCPL
jgi:intergrase/recombinase